MTAALRSTPPRSRLRAELRERFVRFGLNQFTDCDALILLLGFAMPRRSPSPAAMSLIEKYGSFRRVLDAPIEDLLQDPLLDNDSAALIKLARALPEFYLKKRAKSRHDEACNHADLLKYLRSVLCAKRKEEFWVVFLDTHNKVICDEKLGEGTVDRHVVYPRNVLERAMAHDATGMIFAHNHPSGSLNPSFSDREVNNRLVEAARLLDIEVHDHYIVTCDNWFSFRDHGMI